MNDVKKDIPKERRKKLGILGFWITIFSGIITIFVLIFIFAYTQEVLQLQKLEEKQKEINVTKSAKDLQEMLQRQDIKIMQLQNQFQTFVSANEQNESWEILPIVNLIEMANFALRINHDVGTAIQLLQLADTRLSKVKNSNVLTLRQNIANQLLALKAIPQVDITSIILRIQALKNQIANLSIASQTLPKTPEAATESHSFWQNTLAQLKKLVVIRRLDENFTPLTLEEKDALNLNLQLVLQDAASSLLQHNVTLYQQNLNEAKRLINRYYQNTGPFDAITKELAQLAQISIPVTLPNLDALVSTAEAMTNTPNQSPSVPANLNKAGQGKKL